MRIMRRWMRRWATMHATSVCKSSTFGSPRLGPDRRGTERWRRRALEPLCTFGYQVAYTEWSVAVTVLTLCRRCFLVSE
jgi:hypothetical protein